MLTIQLFYVFLDPILVMAMRKNERIVFLLSSYHIDVQYNRECCGICFLIPFFSCGKLALQFLADKCVWEYCAEMIWRESLVLGVDFNNMFTRSLQVDPKTAKRQSSHKCHWWYPPLLSISSTFYIRIFRTNVVFSSYMYMVKNNVRSNFRM